MDETNDVTGPDDREVAVTRNLPLLPLTSGVVLPGHGVHHGPGVRRGHGGRRGRRAGRRPPGASCPSSTGATPSVGVVAEVMESGRAPRRHGRRRRPRRRAGPPRDAPCPAPARPCGSRSSPWSGTPEHRGRRRRAGPRVPGRGGEHPGEPRCRAVWPSGWPDVTEPGRVADMAGYSPDLSLAQKVEVLETLDVAARLRLVLGWAREVLADLTLRERIKTDVEEGMEKTQREFLLRRQLEAIRKELGAAERRRRGPAPTTTAASWPSATCPRRCARRSSGRSTSSSASASRIPSTAGSAPGSTPCSSCPGATSPRTGSTSPRRRGSSTRTTTDWTT